MIAQTEGSTTSNPQISILISWQKKLIKLAQGTNCNLKPCHLTFYHVLKVHNPLLFYNLNENSACTEQKKIVY